MSICQEKAYEGEKITAPVLADWRCLRIALFGFMTNALTIFSHNMFSKFLSYQN